MEPPENVTDETSPSKPDGFATVRVAAPSVRFVQSFALASCWPLPQQLLPASATGGGRRCCLVGEALAFRCVFEHKRFATFCTATARFCLVADAGFGAAGDDSEK